MRDKKIFVSLLRTRKFNAIRSIKKYRNWQITYAEILLGNAGAANQANTT